ncbi:hypothetical protein X734_31715 [Mesorhizobium sp. L2C084A000]|nr:hypothetical protein X734_31715 [Mesorhizobium sp. L2C084A000]
MFGLIVPSHLAEVTHVESLAAYRANHEILLLLARLAAVLLAGDWRAKV